MSFFFFFGKKELVMQKVSSIFVQNLSYYNEGNIIGDYIYTSDSNYIKNMSDEDITIVCSNGNYVLKPNQILITDYNECVNNTRITFGENINDNLEIDELNTKEYIPTKKQEIILDNIIKTIESFNYNVNLIYENGMISGMEIETWTNGGVNMIHTFYFCNDY